LPDGQEPDPKGGVCDLFRGSTALIQTDMHRITEQSDVESGSKLSFKCK